MWSAPLVVAANGGYIPNGGGHVSAVVVLIIVVAVIGILIAGFMFLSRRR